MVLLNTCSPVQLLKAVSNTCSPVLSQDRIDAQEEMDSYEELMCNNRGLGESRVPTEFSEIGRINGSMTKLVEISRNMGLTTGVGRISSIMLTTVDLTGIGSREASIADRARGRQQTRRGHHRMKKGPNCMMNLRQAGGRDE